MLTFNLNKKRYMEIRSGKKMVVYLKVCPYWTGKVRKLFSDIPGFMDETMEVGDWVHCSLAGIRCIVRLEGEKCYRSMTMKINKVAVVDGKETDLAVDKPVYAFYLADIKEVE